MACFIQTTRWCFFQSKNSWGVGAHDVGEGREGVMKLVISCGCHKCMTPKSVKFTTNSITRGSSFFFKSKPQGRYILTAYITPRAHPPASFPTHYSLLTPLNWCLKNQSTCDFQLALGLLNIASWLASNKPSLNKQV